MERKEMTPKVFTNKILTGTAQATLIALIPHAILGGFLKYFNHLPLVSMILLVTQMFQLATPLIIGSMIAKQFNFTPARSLIVGAASFAGSGVVHFNEESHSFIAQGTGDIINVMLTAAVGCLMVLFIGDRFKSLETIAMPLVVGVGAGVIGMLIYPYVSLITLAIGRFIDQFTQFQPILMSILIACSFATLIISPITTIGLGMAIQLNLMSAGAAAMGIAATTIVLVIHSWKVNESGVTLAVALGGMKMMMPNLIKYPVILVPSLFTAMISSLPVSLLNISGTPQSAGFGLIGMVGPLASHEAGLQLSLVVVCWFVIPICTGLLAKFLFEKVLKLYDSKEVFAYQG
ncbi:PTS sugar transporter subunit IIC [Atopobacter sp. AH10]|uniref:PTS sugar transporter subunit IIC n=1 Tax=Atopobacter sp. AH10 TaxID=2315861 RepID=UPI000EF23EE9|nr:PTS sugar transporter subunit IIC [Atopobacter sp. AH10]RLK63462.1 PTS sugar transporter subunit IIC [Atopobacter sp. AH10]